MLSRGELKSKSKEQLQGQWGTSVLVVLFVAVITLILIPTISRGINSDGGSAILSIINIVVMWIFTALTASFFFRISKGDRLKFGDYFADGTVIGKGILSQLIIIVLYIPVAIVFTFVLMFSLVASTFAINQTTLSRDAKMMYSNPFISISRLISDLAPIFVTLIVMMLIFTVIMFVIRIFFTFTLTCVAEDPSRGAWECIKLSCSTVKGHFWDLVVMKLSFLGWDILATLSLCIGFLWLIPYKETTYANYYNELRSASNRVDPDDSQLNL